jgi:AcrR family transcriptional regulator
MVRLDSPTAKYARRREEILWEASAQINSHGAGGMTLTAVARKLGLDTSSITYYFKRKDDLTAACLARSLEWQLGVARRAAQLPTPRERVRAFLAEHFALHRRQRDPATPHLALLADMGALPRDVRAGLDSLFGQIRTEVRGFFAAGDSPEAGDQSLIAAAVLLMSVYHLAGWIDRYLLKDFDRIESRMFDLLEHGLAGGGPWPVEFDRIVEDAGNNPALTRFLHAATDLINRKGYVGASVERIAGELGLSTGSFYHHLDNKNDLVVACFKRTFAILESAFSLAETAGGTHSQQLAQTCASLIAFQFSAESPLLRVNAIQALPPDLRDQTMLHTVQYVRHVTGMVSDAIAGGEMRAVDPTLASYAALAAVSAAAHLRNWAKGRPLGDAVALYSRTLSQGIF